MGLDHRDDLEALAGRRWMTPDLEDPVDVDPSIDGMIELVRAIGLTPAWMADALCREPDHDGVQFFPDRGEDSRAAKAICARCLCAEECERFAIEEGIRHGIWGGVSMAQRHRRPKAA